RFDARRRVGDSRARIRRGRLDGLGRGGQRALWGRRRFAGSRRGARRLEIIGDFRRLYALRQIAGRVDRLVELLLDVELGRLLQVLAYLVELGVADHLVDAALEFARQGA